MVIFVHTKKMPNGQWSCYTTYDGYDKAFTGNISVVAQMADWLRDKPGIILWDEPKIY